jgi:hypothetical protein
VCCEPYHDSPGPREWTCAIDGSSSFAAGNVIGKSRMDLTVGGETRTDVEGFGTDRYGKKCWVGGWRER